MLKKTNDLRKKPREQKRRKRNPSDANAWEGFTTYLERGYPCGGVANLDLNDRTVNLVEEGFDMALRIGDLADSSLIAKRVGIARSVVCASPTYLARYGHPEHPDDLVNHYGLQYGNVTYRQQWEFSDGAHRLFAQPKIRIRANNGDALAQAAAAGLGIVSGPTFILSDYLNFLVI